MRQGILLPTQFTYTIGKYYSDSLSAVGLVRDSLILSATNSSWTRTCVARLDLWVSLSAHYRYGKLLTSNPGRIDKLRDDMIKHFQAIVGLAEVTQLHCRTRCIPLTYSAGGANGPQLYSPHAVSDAGGDRRSGTFGRSRVSHRRLTLYSS